VDYIKANNQSTGQRALDPNKNGIVYMGLNEHAPAEASTLNRLNRGAGGAKVVTPGADQDQAIVNGTKVNLGTMGGASAFAASLGLPDQLAVKVAEFLLVDTSANYDDIENARDELASFVQILAQAEMGERKIDRMVLSGHSVGSEIWGDGNGEISYDRLSDLFVLFPKAASQVKHLMMSACSGGGETTMTEYQGMMPGLESVWAYHDSSPGTWSGAMDHMGAWEKATETGKDAAGVDPELAGRFRKGKYVATWNTTDGYQGGEKMDYYDLNEQLIGMEPVFQRHFSGAEEVDSPQTGILRTYYGYVQRGISHPEVPPARRRDLIARRDLTIRLLYFNVVSTKFQAQHQQTLETGFGDAGLSLPNLGELSRDGLRKLLEDLKAAGGSTATQRVVDLLQRGLWELSNDLIPTVWI
jgi:hypothetical protein